MKKEGRLRREWEDLDSNTWNFLTRSCVWKELSQQEAEFSTKWLLHDGVKNQILTPQTMAKFHFDKSKIEAVDNLQDFPDAAPLF